ncbi:MAG: hypothetical protein AB7Q97_25220 [Gammaproteobacteria bacterium]
MSVDRYARLMTDRTAFNAAVHTPLEEAVDTLRRRQAARRAARNETELGAAVPPALRQLRPVALLFRQVATPNYELRRVLRLAREHGMALLVWEYHADRFMTRNPIKYALGRLGFYSGLGRNGGRRIEYAAIIDLDAENGRPLRDINTFRGESLVAFHHRLMHSECPEIGHDWLFDASDWFAAQGGSARSYYPAFLSLFLRHAILFETFLLAGDERGFVEEVFLPAFDAVQAASGMKPLIVQAEPEEWEGDDFWQFYPEPLRRHIGPYRVLDRIANESGPQWATPAEREPAGVVRRDRLAERLGLPTRRTWNPPAEGADPAPDETRAPNSTRGR